MTNRTPLIIAATAAVLLAGCNQKDHTIVAGADGDNANNPVEAPVALPPSITSSKIYRCADSSVAYVDWLSDNKSANIKTDQSGTPTLVTAPEAGQPMTAAGGYEISGSASDASVKIAVPGHASQSCKA
jgi:hypothetical protein